MSKLSGTATLSAITVLESPRVIDKGKTILFDAHLFFYDDPESSSNALMLLRYYNDQDLTFDEVGTYLIHANIARMENIIESRQLSQDLEKKDYVLVGDVIQLIPLNEQVNPKYQPFVNINGIVTSCNEKDHTFHVSAKSYVHVLKDHKDLATLPVHCYAPKTKRWEEYPPRPRVNAYVGVAGFLHSLRRQKDGMVDHFNIEIDQIAYLGRPYVPSTGMQNISSPVAGSASPVTKRTRFSYTDSPTQAKKRGFSELLSESGSSQTNTSP
ncbi:uncharacterized protein C8R40DRAFT_1128581 [Lentinula edodes]|uniref:uncharacterized protein n=1 Tax=Lentinula edodes TaxID=5353 RepID=UPI001E8E9804|nr:uncharacterized protein C8R40DRAFT_1128581 [Lentinula edodes]KAH7869860.1 hypothetical protein C8R40DRAFT_1128581 [Lentinula edodes]